MKFRRTEALVVFAALFALGLGACAGDGKRAPKATPTPAYIATFDEGVCPWALPAGQKQEAVRCGFVVVPEDRAKPDGRKVRLAVAAFKATSATSAPDAIVHLVGGPGFSVVKFLDRLTVDNARPFQDRRDLVFFDQRGTGLSEPSLRCPEVRENFIGRLAEDLRAAESAARANAALLRCHDRLADEGVDFGAYNSAASASDVADVMSALGYGDYNIYGISYGTRLALTVMRDFPEHVRSVVLDSSLPPQINGLSEAAKNFERALNTLFDGCKADAACHDAYPNAGQNFFDLVAKLNKEPAVVEPQDSSTKKTARVVVNGDRLVAGTWQALYNTRLIPVLPFAGAQIAQGNTGLLTVLAGQIVFSFNDLSDGMAASVNCHDEVPFNTEETVSQANKDVRKEITDAGIGVTSSAQLKRELNLCKAWGAGAANDRENEAVSSDIPTLVLAGEYDPITPPAWGTLAAQTLSHSFVVEFPATGHGALGGQYPCAAPLIVAFYDDPSTRPDATCASAIPPPKFQLP
jgi:pimeloyl-ACP methyl ester carboxylesterase